MTDPQKPARRQYGGHPGTESVQLGVSLTSDTLEALDRRAADLNLTRSGTIHHLLRSALGLPPLYPLSIDSHSNA